MGGSFRFVLFSLFFLLLVSSAYAGAQFSIEYNLQTLDNSGHAADSFAQGDQATLRTRVSNFGDTGAYVTVYHEILNESGTKKYGPVTTTVSVASINDAYGSTSPTLSASTYPAGTYTYKAYISPCDPSKRTCERTKTFTVTAPPPPELAVTGLRASNTSSGSGKSAFTQGETVYIKATVENTGGTSGTTTVSFRITKDGSIKCTQSQSVTVSASDSASATKSCATSTSWATGTYDYEASISPCSSDSCSIADTFDLYAPGTLPSPSFRVDSIYMDNTTSGALKSDFAYGERIALRTTGRNNGTGAGTGSYMLYVKNSAGSVVHNYTASSYVSANGAYYTYSIIPTNITAGNYTYTTTVSPCLAPNTCGMNMSFSVTGSAPPSPAASFRIDSIYADNGTTGAAPKSNFTQGERVMLRTTGRNIGSATGTAASSFSVYNSTGARVFAASANAASIAAGSTYYSYTPITAGLTAGTYTYRVTVSPCSAPNTCDTNMSIFVSQPPPPPAPSFSIDSVYADNGSTGATPKTEFKPGERIVLRTTGRNRGTLSGSGTNSFSLINGSGAMVRTYTTYVWTGAGATYYTYYTVTGTLPNGTYTYRDTISPCNSTCERNLTLRVGMPPLAPAFTLTGTGITNGTADKTEFKVGEPARFVASIMNNGTGPGPLNVTITVAVRNMTMYFNRTEHSLDPGTWLFIDEAADTTLWPPGDYQYRIVVSPCTAPGACEMVVNFSETARLWTAEEIYAMEDRPEILYVTPAEFKIVASRAIAEGRSQEFYPNMSREEADRALYTAMDKLIDGGSTWLVMLEINYDQDLLQEFYEGVGGFIDTTEDGNKRIYTPALLDQPVNGRGYIDVAREIDGIERAGGVLDFVGLGIGFVQGIDEHNGSWTNAIVFVGEQAIENGGPIVILASTTTVAAPVELIVLAGNFVPELNIIDRLNDIDFVRETKEDLYDSAYLFADRADYCIRGENSWHCVNRVGGAVQSFMIASVSPAPVINGFGFVPLISDESVNATYTIENVGYLRGGRIAVQLQTVTTHGAYLQTQFFDINPSETISGSISQPLDGDESVVNATLRTFVGCSGDDVSSCLGLYDSKTVAAPVVDLVAEDTMFYVGGTSLQFIAKVKYNGNHSIIGESMQATHYFNFTRFSCYDADFDECTLYYTPTTDEDIGTHQISYTAWNEFGLWKTAYVNLTVLPALPPYPIQLLSPANGSAIPYSTSLNFTWSHVPGAASYRLNAYNPATRRTYYPSVLNYQTIARYCTSGTCAPPWIILTRGDYLWNVTGTYANGTAISSETRAVRIS